MTLAPLSSSFNSSSSTLSLITVTFLCLLLVPLVTYIKHVIVRRRARGFPFMKFPPEIRLQIYENLIDDYQATTPPRPKPDRTSQKHDHFTLPASLRSLLYRDRAHIFTVLTSVNRQMREEFLHVFCQRSAVHFTLDASHPARDTFWSLTAPLQRRLQTVHLNMLASPDLVADVDPRVVTGNWQLQHDVVRVIAGMTRLRYLRLSIQACGNQLWNPISLWYFTSQSFKTCKVAAFKRMSFDLEGWDLREPNHLERDEAGRWEWRCSENHLLLPDSDALQPLRDFCGALCAECRVCDPVQEQQEDAF